MIAAQFTPGPWSTNVARLSDGSINVAHVVGPDLSGVAQLCALDDDQTEANARLIAAAPELYEGLDSLVELIADFEQTGFRMTQEQLAKVRRCEAALATARGDQ